MTQYIPLTIEQKYFMPLVVADSIAKEVSELKPTAASGAEIQTPVTELKLDQPLFAEPKNVSKVNNSVWWALGISGVVAVISYGTYLHWKKKQNDRQQAQELQEKLDKKMQAQKNKVTKTTSKSAPPQLPGNFPVPPQSSPQSPGPAQLGLANYPDQQATGLSTP